MTSEIRYSVRCPLGEITLDRPPLNVISTAMLDALREGLERAEDDPAVRLIRIGAVGKMFSAGVDVADHVGDGISPMMRSLTALFTTFEQVSKPTVAVVDGAALGGGCELVLATDLCLASERASFGQPEIKLGLFAPPASVLLPRLIGERHALGLLLSGETIPAQEARALGLVNEVLAVEGFEEQVARRLERLGSLSGAALKLAKQAVRDSRGLDVVEAHRRVESLYLERLMATDDAAEGLTAFTEKRPPRWRHR